MPALPLTHHEILGLVEPFTRRGRHLDLAASDRLERRLAFKPVTQVGAAAGAGAGATRAAEPAAAPDLHEALLLACLGTGSYRLTRTLTRPDGLQATLQATGQQPGDLLAHIEAVAPAQQFESGAGFVLARSYGFDWIAGAGADGRPAALKVLRSGVAVLDGLTLTLTVTPVKGVAADLQLVASGSGDAPALPEDLLAVLGWDWARLVPQTPGWTSKVRLRGNPARRSHTAEAALQRAALHLAQLLAAPPAQFHQRYFWARWGVVLRRAIPSLTAVALISTALLLPRLTGGQHSGLWMALHYVPIALLALSFSLQELARFEIPPLPRRLRAPGWFQAATPRVAGRLSQRSAG